MMKQQRFMTKTLFTLLLMLSGFATTWAQNRTISGTVTDTKGEALPSVTVIEKGTQNGVITDFDGKYSLKVNDKAATLVFTFVGFTTKEVAVGAQTNVSITLEEDAKTLGEVIVVGYGAQKKSDLTGVVSSVNEKNFNRGALTSPEQLLMGKVAGVQITSNNGGEPGASSTIRIRGGTSINASNEPLYVIDGVPVDNAGNEGSRNPLNFLNPSDIANITVLKDASAAAIYGSRGANGVIIITTKRGANGSKMKITYDASAFVSQITKGLPIMTGDEMREAAKRDTTGALLKSMGKENTDWVGAVTRPAFGTSHALTLTGGAKNSNYRASVGYQNTNGILKKTSTDRLNLALSYNTSLFKDQLTIGTSIKTGLTNDKFAPGIGGAVSFSPTEPIYSNDTATKGFNEWTSELASKNPVAELEFKRDAGNSSRTVGNIQLDYKIPFIDGLSANLNLGYDYQQGRRRSLDPIVLRGQRTNGGYARVEEFTRNNSLLDFVVNYKREIKSLGKFEIMGGYSYQDFAGEFNVFKGQKLLKDFRELSELGGVADSSSIAKEILSPRPPIIKEKNKLISFFGRAVVNIKEKYLLTATLRQDGSTRFGPQNQYGYFPSAAVAWRIMQEDFMKGASKTISDLKLRFSYGTAGNQDIPNGRFVALVVPGTQFAQYQLGDKFYTTLRLGAADRYIRWEKTASTNFGLDFGLFNNRVSGTLDLYNKKTTDLLFTVTAPAGTNLTNEILTNIGSINNNGFEASIEVVPIAKKNINWSIGMNASFNDNKVSFLEGNTDPKFQGYRRGGISGGVGNQIQILRVGQPVGSFLVYRHKYNENGTPVADRLDGQNNDKAMYEDTNGDGILNDLDRVAYKQSAPRVLLGLTSNFNYGNFDANIALRGSIGNYVYNNVASAGGYFNRLRPNQDNTVYTLEKSYAETQFTQPQYFSDYYLEDGSFLRIENVSVGYSVPNVFKTANKSANLRVFATVQNPYIFTKYKGLDPEARDGIDNNIYPRARTYSLGLSLGF